PARCLRIARAIVAGKLRNQRFVLRRHGQAQRIPLRPARLLLARAVERTEMAANLDWLRGIEGAGARAYFAALGMLLPPCASFSTRSRRPPRDLGNALLSYGYAVLLTECVLAIRSQGLDPALGCLHQPHHDQPALALDLMEEFRPLVVDAAVLDLTRHGRITAQDGSDDEQGGIRLGAGARSLLIQAVESRLATPRTLPGTAQPLSLRALLRRQARLVREALCGRAAFIPLPLP
ncbi:MAG TPA: CRISPR-associated endonuclease Cas1, partial [Chloroflexota bacterium]|nr:CRISPR-associated endonuclease Cas1 [Chloroflexota bacterium]